MSSCKEDLCMLQLQTSTSLQSIAGKVINQNCLRERKRKQGTFNDLGKFVSTQSIHLGFILIIQWKQCPLPGLCKSHHQGFMFHREKVFRRGLSVFRFPFFSLFNFNKWFNTETAEGTKWQRELNLKKVNKKFMKFNEIYF